jgi:opacity protein-like surface antigen
MIIPMVLGLALLLPGMGWAQASSQQSITELKAKLYDAQQEAAKAKADADKAQASLEEAKKQAPPPPVPVPVAAEPAPDPELQQAQEDLRRAREEAEEASAAARGAPRARAKYPEERKNRFARSGVFITGNVFWAPELWDTSLNVDNTVGGSAGLGYRINSRFEVEVRYEQVQPFEIKGPVVVGDVTGWDVTANGRFFLLTGGIQPYLGIGIGAFTGDVRLLELQAPNRYERFSTTVPIFRPSGGFDFYISERLALNIEGAVNLPGGDLTGLDYATVGGGIKLRF